MDSHTIKELKKMVKGVVYTFQIGVLAKNVETDASHRFLTDEEKNELNEKLGRTSNLNDNTVTFSTEPRTRELLKSGEKMKNFFPQINAWFRGLKQIAFTADCEDLENFPEITERVDIGTEGYITDARGLKKVNDKFGEMWFERNGDEIYAAYEDGADTVRKKLGSGHIGKLVDALGARENKECSIDEYYGFCTRYDLSMLPDYRDISIGANGNTVVSVFSGEGTQIYNYSATPALCNQGNFSDTIDMSTITCRNFNRYLSLLPDANGDILKCNAGTGWKVESYPFKEEPLTYRKLDNFMLYNPSTGQLYHFNSSTIHSTTISVYRIG